MADERSSSHDLYLAAGVNGEDCDGMMEEEEEAAAAAAAAAASSIRLLRSSAFFCNCWNRFFLMEIRLPMYPTAAYSNRAANTMTKQVPRKTSMDLT